MQFLQQRNMATYYAIKNNEGINGISKVIKKSLIRNELALLTGENSLHSPWCVILCISEQLIWQQCNITM